MKGAGGVGLGYRVALAEVATSGVELTTRVDEDLLGRAAGHSIHTSYRTSSDQTIPAIQETPVDSPRVYAIRLNAPAVNWSVTLISPDGVRRDFKARPDADTQARVPLPYRILGAIVGTQRWPSGSG